MFNLFKKKKEKKMTKILEHDLNSSNTKDSDTEKDTIVKTATGVSMTNSVGIKLNETAKTFAKPNKYTGNRAQFDNGGAKKGVKLKALGEGAKYTDPYTGKELVLRKSEAKLKFGDKWQEHLAEGDHVVPLEKIFNGQKNNAWVKTDDIKNIANDDVNMEAVSRKFNNAKRSRSNEELVTDEDYLNKTGLKLTDKAKKKAIEKGNKTQSLIDKKFSQTSVGNAIKTGHNAGKYTATNTGVTTATISSITNITAVIKGEKNAEEALVDTTVDTGKAALSGYVMGGGLTTVSHTLSTSSSKFVQALSKSNVPGQVITAVMVVGNTLDRYSKGEISTQECMIELGEKGLTFATTGYSMAVGQAIIPIPIVGAAVGALVGSAITSNYYNSLMCNLQKKDLEHKERLRILAECEIALKEAKAYRNELESYLDSYFHEYKDCFDEALSDINVAFQTGDADGVIAGANQITRKLGGNVHYETVEEFGKFLEDDTIDVL